MRPTKKARFFDNIRSTIKQLTSTGGGGFTRQLLEADISADCVLGLLQFMRAFRELEPWALRQPDKKKNTRLKQLTVHGTRNKFSLSRHNIHAVFDATAKYPTGFLQATSAELGAYDECIETVVRDEDGAEKVRGQYCNMRLSITDEDSFLEEILPAIAFTHRRASKFGSYFVDKKLPGLRLGLCFVSSCSAQDLTNIAQTMAGNRAKIVVDNCVTSVDDGISGTQAGIIAYLAILAMVIVAATGLDLLTERWDKNRKNAIPYKCAMAFSALSNSRLIMGINKDKNSDNYSFRFMHGIRFLSIFWICLGHSYGTISENFSRMLNAVQYFERWETLIVTAGYLAVDTFFFLSGFLLYYTLSRQQRNRAVVTVVAIIRRYVRITVPLFFMLMCMYLLPLIASGPNSKDLYNRFYAEIRKHWWDLLFLMRNWRADQEVTILPHLWYLSIDYQLFLVGVVVIQVLKTRKWLVACTFALLSLVCCGISAWEIYGTNMTPFVVAVAENFSTVVDTLNYSYLHPFYHGVCFFSGCITFLLVEKYSKAKISKMIVASLWCISLFCGLYCLFMKLEWYRSNERGSETRRTFHAFTDRIFWSVGVAWFVFTCATGRGGLVNRFLSWDGFVPLSRLSFCVYLIHSPIFVVTYHVARERIFFSHYTLVSQCFAVLVWSYIVSYFLFIACDAPTGHLEKLVFMPQGRRETSQNGAPANGVSNRGDSNGNNVKDLPIGIIEEGVIKNNFNGVSLSPGDAAECDGSCTKKCYRL
ncbi:nose resistant to fluoxetine protein 6-like [Amblyomma americanum]